MIDVAHKICPDWSHAVHLCVDMQRLFADNTDWAIPWLPRILPNVTRIVRAMPERTIFTRFMPPSKPEDTRGAWRAFYERWRHICRDRLPPDMLELVPELKSAAPHAPVIDKTTFSPWHFTDLDEQLRKRNCDCVIVSGGESDMCVLATVLGAIDIGYRAVVVTDALCSSVDETHDAVMKLYGQRYSQQISAVSTEDLLRVCKGAENSVRV